MLLPAAAGTGTYLLTYTISLFTAASATAVAAAVDGRGTHSRYLPHLSK